MDYATARATLIEALSPLGKKYGELLAYGSDPKNGWIDIYPHAAKRSGAFSASVYGSHPYVLMNFQDSTDDMFTLAHEYGHAIHSHLAMTEQPYSGFRYVPFLAEIASTCNEALVTDYLLRNSKSDAERMSLLVERAENIRTTIFRQTLFAEFEREVHEMVERGDAVTADALNDLYAGLVRDYYGPDYTLDEHDGMEWAYVPHFYYKFYVFTYATGLSSGIAIADRVRELGEPAVQGLFDMLSGGSSDAPLDLLAKAGVDLTQPAPIEAATRLLDETLDELEQLLGAGSR
jgi:oligoendopeptidase F